jgi:peptidase M23-like protein
MDHSGLLRSALLAWLLFLPAGASDHPGASRPHEGPWSSPGSSDSLRIDLHDYIWPTDASTNVTSSFAEYRTNHFHGGIDISTHGHTGYKVFAARDGYVYRIQITPDGYGKMLYLRHRDGTFTTYAHLKTFNAEINKLVRDEQYRRGTYSIDLKPDSGAHPVHKGDVVAYTGDTGFGPPHLHFEIRDSNLNPVNPMLSGALEVADRLPPVVHRLLLSPLTYSSSVDNNSMPKIVRRFSRSKQGLVVPQKLIVHGTIGLGIDVIDRSEGTWSRAGIHRLELYLDDSLTFFKSLDRVPADESKEIDLDYDLPMILQGWGRFQKLYIDAGNSLPFYDHRPEGSGVIHGERLSEGPHAYRIVSSDYQGNKTTLLGTLIVNHRPTIAVSSVDSKEVVLTGTNLDLIEVCHVAGRKLSGTTWSEHTIRRGSFEADATGIELPVDTKRYDILRITAVTKLGSETPPIFYVLHRPHDAARNVSLKTEIRAEYVRFTLNSSGLFTSIPQVTVQEGSTAATVGMQAVDPTRYTGAFVPSDHIEGRRVVTVLSEINGNEKITKDEFTLYPVPSDRRGSFTSEASGLRFSYDSGAVYKPLLLQVSGESYDHSTVYILEPQDRLLNRGIRVSVPSGSGAAGSHRALFFRGTGGWSYRTDRLDEGGGSYSTTLTRTLGELAVLSDDEPPTFGRLRVSAPRGKPSIRFRYRDNLSGVDADQIKVYIDDGLVIPEIDGEHHDAWYQADERLERGKHSVKIIMKDRMQNQAQISRTFTVR